MCLKVPYPYLKIDFFFIKKLIQSCIKIVHLETTAVHRVYVMVQNAPLSTLNEVLHKGQPEFLDLMMCFFI